MKTTANSIVTLDVFNGIMSKLGIFYKQCKIAVAVSGGADSLALLHLVDMWGKKNNLDCIALIVNHNLRENSQQEAQSVAKYLNEHGITNKILIRNKITQQTKIQELARNDRYALLLNYCYDNNIPYLLVGHHLDDQLETLVFRDNKGENQLGLSAMSAKQIHPEAIILRPLLTFDKQTLKNTLQTFGNFWIDDPSNNNEKYSRIQIRNNLHTISADQKKNLQQQLIQNQFNRINLENDFIEAIIQSVKINKFGLIKINLRLFNNYAYQLQILLLRSLIKYTTGNVYGVQINQIKTIIKAHIHNNLYNNGKSLSKISLGGAIICFKKDWITLFREPHATRDKVYTYGKFNLWDNRFIYESHYTKLLKQDLNKIVMNKEYKKYFKQYDMNMEDIFSIPWRYVNNGLNLESKISYKYFVTHGLLMAKFTII